MGELFFYTVEALLGVSALVVILGGMALAVRGAWRCVQAHRTFQLVLPGTKVDVIGLGVCVVQSVGPEHGMGHERGVNVSPYGLRRNTVWLDFHQWRKLATPVLEAE